MRVSMMDEFLKTIRRKNLMKAETTRRRSDADIPFPRANTRGTLSRRRRQARVEGSPPSSTQVTSVFKQQKERAYRGFPTEKQARS